jgi:hypothetical protein|tara:strand:+ start:28495 stop:28740 length:246 start_codon:yes stop_codon:yes gene_type:complete
MTNLDLPSFLIRSKGDVAIPRAARVGLVMPAVKVKKPLPQTVVAGLAELGYTPGQIKGMDRDKADSTIEYQVKSDKFEIER